MQINKKRTCNRKPKANEHASPLFNILAQNILFATSENYTNK